MRQASLPSDQSRGYVGLHLVFQFVKIVLDTGGPEGASRAPYAAGAAPADLPGSRQALRLVFLGACEARSPYDPQTQLGSSARRWHKSTVPQRLQGLLASSRHVRARKAVFPSRCPCGTGTQGHTCDTCVPDTLGDQGNTLTGAGMCMA